MDQFSKILLSIDNAHTVPQRVLECRPGIGGLSQVHGPNCPTPSVQIIYGKYINIFTRCTNRKQHDILITAVADVCKGQTHMSHKGELQTLTKLSMRHNVCPGETCCTPISEFEVRVIHSEKSPTRPMLFYSTNYWQQFRVQFVM